MPKSLYTSNFNKVLKAALFAAIMAVSVYFSCVNIGNVYISVVNKNAINEKSNKRFEDFYALPKNSLDMVFIGSSHSYCTFDPENFDSKLGTSSFQLGMPLQHYDAAYYTLKEVYNYQTPSLVVVEIYWDLLGKDVELKQALTLFDSLKNTRLEKEYVNEVFNIGQRLKYNLDIINYQKDYFTYKNTEIKKSLSKTLGATDADVKRKGEEYYVSKGYVYCDYVITPEEHGRTNQFNGFDGRTYEISQTQWRFLKKLVDLCGEMGSEVVFVTAPVANVSLTKIANYSLVNEKVSNMAASMGVKYIDYNMPEARGGMFQNANFRDDAHLNDSGVKILDAHFIEWLIDNNMYKK